MTILIATVTAECATVSQDTMVVYATPRAGDDTGAPDGFDPHDLEAARRGTFTGNGTAPKISAHAYAPKLWAMPQHRIVMAHCGLWPVALHWRTILDHHIGPRDIRALDAMTPRLLAHLTDRLGIAGGAIVCHFGWSDRDGRVIGFSYNRANGYASELLTGGHHMMPMVNPQGANHGAISRLWMTAARGTGVIELHRLIAADQHASFRAGLFPEGTGIGGELLTATVRRDQVTIQTAMRFPGYDPAPAGNGQDWADEYVAAQSAIVQVGHVD